MVNISRSSLNQLREDNKELKKENKKLGKDVTSLQATIQEKNTDNDEISKENKAFSDQNEDLKKDREHWKNKYDNCMKALKDTGKAAGFEQKEDTKDKINSWIKEIGFRNTKFAQMNTKLVSFTEDCYDALKNDYGWEEEATRFEKSEFVHIYKAHCTAQLSLRRQYNQTQLQKAAAGTHKNGSFVLIFASLTHNFGLHFSTVWWKKHKDLPTVEELVAVYDAPQSTMPHMSKGEELLLWYSDKFLPYAAGCEHYGTTVRQYQMAVEHKTLEDGTTRDKYPNVSIPSEGFALTMYDNSHDKWIAIFKWHDEHGWGKGVKLPKYDKNDTTTHALHKNKWSDSKSGKGSGWHPDAGKAFHGYCKTIQMLRKADRKVGWKKYAHALNLIRDHHEVTATSYSKKRRRKEITPAADKIEWEDEEDDWSVSTD